mmetsp:Transcript_889/g.1847  ORF Transcript_889/g.1847 Transcript_889/m.1847 type:complete len:405 (+) Transcript_889:141-1355(+)
MRRNARTMRRRRNAGRAAGRAAGGSRDEATVPPSAAAATATRGDPSSSTADDGARSARVVLFQRFVKMMMVYAAAIGGIKYFEVGKKRVTNMNKESPALPSTTRTFLAGPNVTVHVVRDFLPRDVALRWRRTMIDEWDATGSGKGESRTAAPPSDPSSGGGAWSYATNNDGSGASGRHNNAKTRGTRLLRERNETAWQMWEAGAFAYAKWELDLDHYLSREIQSTFETKEMTNRVDNVVGDEGGDTAFEADLSDFFVTNYATGDFLTAHDDAFQGSWAFVISLAQLPDLDADTESNGEVDAEWDGEKLGGVLRFECPFDRSDLPSPAHRHPPGPIRWCETVAPSFNSAVFFRTRPQGPRHEVTPVTWEAREKSFGRYGITGWYMEVGDRMSDWEAAELAKATPK